MKNNLKLSRVEIVKRSFDSKGNCIREEWQFYHPPEKDGVIKGFEPKK